MLSDTQIQQLQEAIPYAQKQGVEGIRIVLTAMQAQELIDYTKVRQEEFNNQALEASGY